MASALRSRLMGQTPSMLFGGVARKFKKLGERAKTDLQRHKYTYTHARTHIHSIASPHSIVLFIERLLIKIIVIQYHWLRVNDFNMASHNLLISILEGI